MARTRGKKTVKAKQLTNRFLRYKLRGSDQVNPDSFYIDLAKDLSLSNRRLYRQGRMYHIANITVTDTSGATTKVKFGTLPINWTTSKAWNNFFDAWKDQRATALLNAPSDITGRWADFKCAMNHQAIIESCAEPVDSDGNDLPAGDEWRTSEVSFNLAGADKEDQKVFMMGNHQYNNATPTLRGVGVLASLQEIMQRPVESPVLPTTFDDSVILGMNPTILSSNEDILQDIATDNDLPPYASLTGLTVIGAGNPGLTGNDQSLVTREVGWFGPGSGLLSDPIGLSCLPVMGFPVPLGLLEVRMDTTLNRNEIGITIELVPGTYKGVHSEAF